MSDSGSEAGTETGTAAPPNEAGTGSTAQPRESDSSIVSVTADFSMQNVLLQVRRRHLRCALTNQSDVFALLSCKWTAS